MLRPRLLTARLRVLTAMEHPVSTLFPPLRRARLAVDVLYEMAKADRSAVGPAWCHKWGWYPLLNVVQSSNVTMRELLTAAGVLTELARDDGLFPLITNATSVEIVYRLARHTHKFLMGSKRAPFSMHRERVKELQVHVAGLLWATVASKDPGQEHFTVAVRVSTVLHFLNSPRQGVATAGAGLTSLFARSAKFATSFVNEGGVTTLLRRARTSVSCFVSAAVCPRAWCSRRSRLCPDWARLLPYV